MLIAIGNKLWQFIALQRSDDGKARRILSERMKAKKLYLLQDSETVTYSQLYTMNWVAPFSLSFCMEMETESFIYYVVTEGVPHCQTSLLVI